MHLLRAELVCRIDTVIRRHDDWPAQAAQLLGLSQPNVSRLLPGYCRENSPERLFGLLAAPNRDVTAVV